jgi:hypothetical protein
VLVTAAWAGPLMTLIGRIRRKESLFLHAEEA